MNKYRFTFVERKLFAWVYANSLKEAWDITKEQYLKAIIDTPKKMKYVSKFRPVYKMKVLPDGDNVEKEWAEWSDWKIITDRKITTEMKTFCDGLVLFYKLMHLAP